LHRKGELHTIKEVFSFLPGGNAMTETVLRTMLWIDMGAILFLALYYLRQRNISWKAFCAWGSLALCVPFLGPFLVIYFRPGAFTRNTKAS